MCVDGKYLGKYFNEFLGIGIKYLLMNLLSCHGFTNNIKYIVILKCPSRMLEYYFPKGFGILERNSSNLKKYQIKKNTEFMQRKHTIQTML